MTDEQREAIEAGAKTMEWVATMPNSAMLRYAIVLRSMLSATQAPSPSDAAFGKGIPTSLEVAWDDFAQRKGLAPHSVNAYAVEFARERCADLQAQFRAHMEQAPSREGWLTRERVENLRDTLIRNDYAPATVNALCDMALSALRPAPTDKPCCEAECYGCGLKYSTHAHNSCPKCGSILRGDTAHIETGKRRALRPAGDEGLRIKAALAIIEAEGCDCDAEFRDEHTCLAGRIENALAPLPAAPKSPADGGV